MGWGIRVHRNGGELVISHFKSQLQLLVNVIITAMPDISEMVIMV